MQLQQLEQRQLRVRQSSAPKAIDGQSFNDRQLYFVTATGKWGYYDSRNQFTLTQYRDVVGQSVNGKQMYATMSGKPGFFARPNDFVLLGSARHLLLLAGKCNSRLDIRTPSKPTGHQAPKVKQN